MKSTVLSLLLTVSYFLLPAQNFELGAIGGLSIYNGDIQVNQTNVLQQARFDGGFFVRTYFTKRFGLRAQLLYVNLYADEAQYPTSAYRKERGMSFKTSLVEMSILPEWRPLSIGNIDLNIFAGIGGSYFKPKTNFNEPNAALIQAGKGELVALDKNADFSKLAITIPFGIGLQWTINQSWAIGGEISGRKTFSDYYDGISKVGGEDKDSFYTFNVTVSKLFDWGKGGGRNRMPNGTVRCPKF